MCVCVCVCVCVGNELLSLILKGMFIWSGFACL